MTEIEHHCHWSKFQPEKGHISVTFYPLFLKEETYECSKLAQETLPEYGFVVNDSDVEPVLSDDDVVHNLKIFTQWL